MPTTILTTRTTEYRAGYELARDGRITWIGDSHHFGTDVYYSERLRRWVCVNHEDHAAFYADRIAAIQLSDPEEDYDTLPDGCLACDLDGRRGLYLVDADILDGYTDRDAWDVIFCEPADSPETRPMPNPPVTDLITLLHVLRDEPADEGQRADYARRYGLRLVGGDIDWSDLPTFGGRQPQDNAYVWSWDETHLLVGSCAGDLQIVRRDEREI